MERNKPCRAYAQGKCTYGSRCKFSHGKLESNRPRQSPVKTASICRFYQSTGTCRYGDSCKYSHEMAASTPIEPVITAPSSLSVMTTAEYQEGTKKLVESQAVINQGILLYVPDTFVKYPWKSYFQPSKPQLVCLN
jgi:Zinc finger C-x8-C-x5-C-x3-H type (and similar)/CCCH-type zinc finger